MNTHAAASGAGRATVIHLGLGLKCSKRVFSRIKYELHQVHSANGGWGPLSYMPGHPPEVGVGGGSS